jgi:hypothetical protein
MSSGTAIFVIYMTAHSLGMCQGFLHRKASVTLLNNAADQLAGNGTVGWCHRLGPDVTDQERDSLAHVLLVPGHTI